MTTTEDLLKSICAIEGVTSAVLDEREPFVHVRLAWDSQTTIDRVKVILHDLPAPLFPRFRFDADQTTAQLSPDAAAAKDTDEMSTLTTNPEIPVPLNDPHADTVVYNPIDPAQT